MSDQLNGSEPILLSPPHLDGNEQEHVAEAFRTNWIAPVGPNLDRFESELCKTAGIGHACAVSSGTAAIHLALMLLGVGPGDLVLCSSFTFVASANPIRYCGAEPVFVDSEPGSWCMSPTALERVLQRLAGLGRTPRACVAVSIYGQPLDIEGISRICSRYGVKVLDEAAEALGASFGGRMAGTGGDLGVYSFNGNKIITTSGGGALVGSDPELIERARFLATQARAPSSIRAYEHHETGYNYRLSNVLAGIGIGQLALLQDRVGRRRGIFQRYVRGLDDLEEIEWMPEIPGGVATRWLSCCLLPDQRRRDKMLEDLRREGIEARPVWKPMHLQQTFAGCIFESHEEGVDVSAELFRRGACLPSGSNLSPADQERVITAVRSSLR